MDWLWLTDWLIHCLFSVVTGWIGPDRQEEGGNVCSTCREEMADLLQQEEGDFWHTHTEHYLESTIFIPLPLVEHTHTHTLYPTSSLEQTVPSCSFRLSTYSLKGGTFWLDLPFTPFSWHNVLPFSYHNSTGLLCGRVSVRKLHSW